ncbi:MAG: hypothetical protein AAB595_02665 [Patescibacteria group bacterium]
MEQEQKPKITEQKETKKIYSPEKNAEVSAMLGKLRLKVFNTPNGEQFFAEIEDFNAYLRKKYNVMQYAMMHAFMGSTINPNREAEILYDDFPGDDSIETFVNNLVRRYG